MPIAYRLLRTALFQLPAESVHEASIAGFSAMPKSAREAVHSAMSVDDPRLRTTVAGIPFANPVGLAAGFDKGGSAFNGLATLGFGFVEIGTVTGQAQPGNPRPRLFRLPRDRALLNRMGFNNPGAREVADRLQDREIETVLGINIGKSKVTPLEEAPADYVGSVRLLRQYADYMVVNVSSPNTPGLRQLQGAEPLRQLLRQVFDEAVSEDGSRIPIFVKLAPDLTEPQLDEAVGIALETGVAGIVAVNTTISRNGLRTDPAELAELGDGGISGAPIGERADQIVAHIYRATEGRLPIIGVGGIFTADDAWRRIEAGASLVQLYTGFVYGGPGVVRRINRGLLERMTRLGIDSIRSVVGRATV